jgi:heat-inducible transcriptional repressor
MPALSERAKRILHAVVVGFIETGEPVGSRTLAETNCRDLSAATIRNVLAELEEGGYLYQPHTSAGRVPTDKAFRTFVDGLMTVSELSGKEEAEIRTIDEIAPGETLLRESGRILSELAGLASVIMSTRGELRVLSELRFVCGRANNTLVALLMFRDGSLETRFVETEDLPGDDEIERIHNLLASVVPNKTLHEVRNLFVGGLSNERTEIDLLTRHAFQLGLAATEQRAADEPLVMVQGQSRLIDRPDFKDVIRLRQLIRTLEQRRNLVRLLDKTIRARTVQVLVGRETGNLADGGISIVVASFSEQGRQVGTISAVGPTRMDYARVVPLVAATASAVSTAHDRALGEQPRRSRRRGQRSPDRG